MYIRRIISSVATAVLTLAGGSLATAQEATPQSSFPNDLSSQALGSVIGELPEVEGGVDLESFVGTWHQVAATPQPFQAQCVRNVKAEYKLINSKTIGVTNSCDTPWGQPSVVKGSATVKSPASLRVAFDNVPFQDKNGAPNYRVTWFNADKTVALVGSPGKTAGFVLSRTPQLSSAAWDEVSGVIAARGWSPCLFFQTGGPSLCLR